REAIMKTIPQMRLGELAAYVCSHLASRGIHVVLSGGGCVAIYASGPYSSMDLDFIARLHATRRKLKGALAEIGFTEKNRYFVHPDTQFFLEFPSGPLAVGSEPVAEVEELHLKTGTLRLLSPTDCIKDRLAAFYHWNDRQCLQQAVWVALEQQVDWEELERWSRQEEEMEKFEMFRGRFKADGVR
ncbi:MAG TPA: hypothetical protein VD811_04255, partial [Desulfuromonadales bacterium]|nr:hypothetical protein [Desulfuromonadales bacterium]